MSTTRQRNLDGPVAGVADVEELLVVRAVLVTVVPFSSERARVTRGLPALA
jgi:hypothetical protein